MLARAPLARRPFGAITTLLALTSLAACDDSGSATTGSGASTASSGPGSTTGASMSTGTGGAGGNPVIGEAHPRIYLKHGNKERLAKLLTDQDPAATRFADMVATAEGGGDVYAYEAWYSALLGQLTGEAKHCTDAIGRVDAWVTDEESRIAAGQAADVAGDSYLEVGPIVGNLSLVLDWCYDAVTPAQRARWIAYANQAVWNVWHPNEAKWGAGTFGWSGWSIDNPSNNYYYSFLKATMLLGLASKGENADADGWITKFRDEKIGGQLVPAFTKDLAGGGSREGTGYGVSMKGLYWLYDVWEASTTERIADLTPHTKSSLAYLIHETVPTLDRVAPIGDHARDSTASLFDYHREYGLALAWLYSGDPLAAAMRTYLGACSVPEMSQGFEYVFDFLYRDPGATSAPLSTLATTYFPAGTGHLFARSAWDTSATWIGFLMGPYTESHAHHDQLSLLLYKDAWLAYDGNIDTHSGIFQGEEAHSLVRITKNGQTLRQTEGTASDVFALHDDADFLYAGADATAVYGSSGVNLAEREIVFLKPDVLVVFDRVDAGASASHVWQLASPSAATINGNTATIGGNLVVRTIHPTSGSFANVALPSVDADFQAGSRLDRTQSANGPAFFLHVLSVDGAVTSATDATQGADEGVALSLTGGVTATVRFHESGHGGTLQLSKGGNVVFDGALPQGVAAPPVLAP
ncbi:MAG: hypothetical protein U0414_05975 [Polyangiaceae bacterium]